ncbi:MAG: alginate lyase family protein [Geminicoccaceae bacterium]
MTSVARCFLAATIAVLAVIIVAPAGADGLLTGDDRRKLDLSQYVVTDRHAGYFDVAARMQWLRDTSPQALRQQVDRLRMEVGCRDKLALPIIDHELRMPGFYQDHSAWREAIRPLFAFENAVSDLAGAFVASGDRYFADCLIDLLGAWAAADALTKFYYSSSERQAWFNIEDMLFAAGLAYAAVRDQIEDRASDKLRIDAWLARAARIHLSIEGGRSSCCNNHFYRRALYATVIGVLNEDHALFRIGAAAIYSALNEMGERGELPREVSRGDRAVHYQNYAVLYLVSIAELIARQGYDIYALSVNGRTLHDAVALTMTILEDPRRLGQLAPNTQDLRFIDDDQYFSWMEVYLSRFENARIERWLMPHRPIYNRSAGGYLTLYFWEPNRVWKPNGMSTTFHSLPTPR